MSHAEKRAEMPKGTNSVLDRRTVVNGNANLLSLVKRGDRVLDVGCGTGAITKDIAMLTGKSGFVLGIDSSEHLIQQAQDNFSSIENLRFDAIDINSFPPDESFDVVTSARVLQWLANPADVLSRMKDTVKPGGYLTILDYNHERIEFHPSIPDSMKHLYDAFLKWRNDAGMDNAIADHLEQMFGDLGLNEISVSDYSEVSVLGKESFHEDLAIWKKVAETRGKQLVTDGYVTEELRLKAISEYDQWIAKEAKYMKLYLLAVTGNKPD